MARKRMISPEIWENQSFGELSLLAKVLFIGMISQADDDGKGVLSPQLLKSKILPYDELRIADIDKALKEIGHNASVAESADADKAREERGHKMSVVYYEVGGKKYYRFENWKKWQTINRPIPSKLPDPLVSDGVRGGIHSHEEITNNSMSTHTQFNECSRPIEDINRNINNTHTDNARSEDNTFEEAFRAFCERWNISVDTCSSYMNDFDFDKLNKAFEESPNYLQNADAAPWAHTISGIIKNLSSIYAGKYKDKVNVSGTYSSMNKGKSISFKAAERQRTFEILKSLYESDED